MIRRKSLVINGAGRRIRTDDLLITNQLLYQLSYTGEKGRATLMQAGGSDKPGEEHLISLTSAMKRHEVRSDWEGVF